MTTRHAKAVPMSVISEGEVEVDDNVVWASCHAQGELAAMQHTAPRGKEMRRVQ